MSNFAGITPDAMWLLAENRFHDSKSFYEEKKPQIQAQVLRPLRALLEDLTPFMLDIDPQFVTEPGRNGNISRIRRDNRYTRDKSMYRENAWIVFERDKKAWVCSPGFFVDISGQGSSWGMGFYQCPPVFLQFLRRRMDENPRPFIRAVERAQAAGFSPMGDRYARPKKPDAPAALDGLYNRKSVDMIRGESDMAFFGGPELADTLRRGFAELAPLYHLLMEAIEAFAEILPDHR